MCLYEEAVNLKKQFYLWYKIRRALDKLKKETVCVSEAVEIWLDLLSFNVLLSYHLNNRFQQVIHQPHSSANVMDPKFRV